MTNSIHPVLRIALIGLLVFIVLLVAAGAWIATHATIDIAKPSGPHPVGFTSTTLTDPARGRVITLDTWYPASTTQGTSPEPYTEKALADLLSKYQHIPAIGSEVASLSFRDAPMQSGKHPVITFNHGYGSFTKQNFSNFQELASQGWLIVSIGHPAESLLARDAKGAPLVFDDTSTIYKRMLQLQTQDAKAYTRNLAEAIAIQRGATDAASFEQVSQMVAQTPPYSFLEPLASAWEQDTRFVIANLDRVPGADGSQVVMMGHSLGGMVTLALAKNPPAGVRAAINLDGPWVRYGNDSAQLKVPVLIMLSTENVFGGDNLSLAGTFDPLLRVHSTGAYVVEIAGTAHFNFTDLSYAPIMRYLSPVIGSVDATDMINWQRDTLAEFLRRVQTGDLQVSPLLAQNPKINQRFFPVR